MKKIKKRNKEKRLQGKTQNNKIIEDKKSLSKEQILLEFLISDVTKIVLSYMDKHKLKYNKSIRLEGKQVLTDGKHIYIHDIELNTIETQSNLYQRSLRINPPIYHIPKNHICQYMIDENTCILYNRLGGKFQYKIFNIKTSQIIKNIIVDNLYIALCSNDKYIIFVPGSDKISIFSIEKMEFIENIGMSFKKISIIDNILYILVQYPNTIYKYNIVEKKMINIITFKEPSRNYMTILTNEIVVFWCNEIIFYDLDGKLISKTAIDKWAREDHVITQDHIYIADENDGYTHHIYKRTL
jgi:hypothetical protein